MINRAIKITLTVMIAGLLVSAAYAGPITLNKTQMDSVTAGGVDKVSAFLCTVNVHGMDGLLNADNHANTGSVLFNLVNGVDKYGNNVTYVTVVPLGAQDLSVSPQATNTGTPTLGFSAPGQSTYTAIWEVQQPQQP